MSKNFVAATKFIIIGNYYYLRKRYREALLSYNRSLCLIEPGTRIASICYGKRSLVYFDLEEYKLCIVNIDLAIQSHPTNKTNDVANFNELRGLCQELMATQHVDQLDENPMNFFQLSYPANERLPCLSNCLQLRVNKQFGRHIVSNRYLNVGDIVAVTDCSFRFFNKDARLHNCSYCLKNSTKLSLIPCTRCAKTMYCSTECMEIDKRKFHQYECGINDDSEEQYKHLNALRMLVHILDEFDGDVDKMNKFLENAFDGSTVFDFDLSNKNDSNFEKNLIKATLSMGSNINLSQNTKDQFLQYNYRVIKRHKKLLSRWTPEHGNDLNSLLCKLLLLEAVEGSSGWHTDIDMSVPLRDGNFDKPRTTTNIYYYNNVANVIDPYLGLVNQNCFPNIIARFVNNQHVWIVVRPIQAGEQLFLFSGLGVKYRTPRVERQEMILKHFGFKCRCEGCVNNWPVFRDMRQLTIAEIASARGACLPRNMLLPEDHDEYISYASLIQGVSQYYPCKNSITVEAKWMLNICRLSQPAKWFSVKNTKT